MDRWNNDEWTNFEQSSIYDKVWEKATTSTIKESNGKLDILNVKASWELFWTFETLRDLSACLKLFLLWAIIKFESWISLYCLYSSCAGIFRWWKHIGRSLISSLIRISEQTNSHGVVNVHVRIPYLFEDWLLKGPKSSFIVVVVLVGVESNLKYVKNRTKIV